MQVAIRVAGPLRERFEAVLRAMIAKLRPPARVSATALALYLLERGLEVVEREAKQPTPARLVKPCRDKEAP